MLPPEVERLGLDAFTQIGEDVKETIEKRAAAFIVVRTIRPKFVPKVANTDEKPVMQADAVPSTVPKAQVGPTALAESIVLRWGMYLPLFRLEKLYAQQGFPVARSTVCAWHFAAHEAMLGLLEAMWADALRFSAVLCTDATGVKVQAPNECRNGHFFTVVAPNRTLTRPTFDAAIRPSTKLQMSGLKFLSFHSRKSLYFTGNYSRRRP